MRSGRRGTDYDEKGAQTDFVDISNNASAATAAEKSMSIREGLRLYPKAIGWSVLLSLAIVMEGYDVVLLATFYAFPKFQEQFGTLTASGTYELSASWQAGLSNGANVGEIIGLFATGVIADRFGYRKTMIGALAAVTCFIFIPFFATNVQTLLVAEILCGIPWGVFQTLTCQYASEVMPTCLRAPLTTFVNLCWVMGQLIASGVLRGMLSNNTQWAYKIPMALQWMWPVPLIIGICLAPESPWWLVRKDRLEDAKKSIIRLTSVDANPDFDADEYLDMIVNTNAQEKSVSEGTSYLDCFKGTDLRRTEIVVCVWAVQNLCGSSFMGYSTYFYQQAGLAKEASFDFTMAQYGLGAIGTVASWFLMAKFGRRTIYTCGLAALCALVSVIGFAGLVPNPSSTLSFVIGSMLLVYTFTYDLTVGPVCYSLVSELSSTRLRTKTIVIARNMYNVIGIINNIITPYMLNPTSWNWGAKTGLFWGGICLVCWIWTFFRLPEPKGRTYGELDTLFEHGVSARKFVSTDALQFQQHNLSKMRSYSASGPTGKSGGDIIEHREYKQ